MIAFFTILYCLGIWLIFVKMKIKPAPKNVAVAVVIGIVAVGLIIIFWRFAAPHSGNLVVTRYTVQIVPQVKGPITKIYAEPNVPLKKGEDILFEIQKDVYQFKVDQLTASQRAAEKQIEQLAAGVRAASAGVKNADANLAAAKAALDVALETERINPNAISKLKVVQLTEQFNAASAGVEQATAAEEQADFALAAANEEIGSIKAQLENAKFDLEQCTVYAPADGFVTNWQVREGTMSVPLPLAPIGTFIDTSRVSLVANYGQNVLTNVRPGDTIEVALKTHPGQVFAGTVNTVLRASGEGQFVTTGQLGSAADLVSPGMFAVKLDLDDEELSRELVMGTAGSVVIYTEKGKPFHVISKVVVRMNAWMYYLNPF